MCIDQTVGHYFQKEIFCVAGISKQAYHKYCHAKVQKDILEEGVLQLVHRFRARHEKMGSRTLFYALNIKEMGVNKFEQLLLEKGLNVQFKRKRRIITTNGIHESQDINLVKGLKIYDINKVIVGDITYFFSEDDLYYIFCLKDAYSKRIVGIYGSKRMTAVAAAKCLGQVVQLRGVENLQNCIHHSDAGSQYKSRLYKEAGSFFNWSIAENCLENGMAEQLNFIIKEHYMRRYRVKSERYLNKLLKEVKYLINEEKPVAALANKTPVAFENIIQQIPLELRKPFQFSSFEKRKKGEL